jgi:hypothetical protein
MTNTACDCQVNTEDGQPWSGCPDCHGSGGRIDDEGDNSPPVTRQTLTAPIWAAYEVKPYGRAGWLYVGDGVPLWDDPTQNQFAPWVNNRYAIVGTDFETEEDALRASEGMVDDADDLTAW